MKITPLKRYRTPEYPIQELLKSHPELLRFIPKRWANTPLMLSALSLACMILAVRDGSTADDRKPPVDAVYAATHVAPIFHHGSGRGSFGCVSTAAPVFLTEDEARQVITEEAAKAGVHFKQSMTTLHVERPVTNSSSGLSFDLRTGKPKTRVASMVMDGTDSDKNISYEFVSDRDYLEWEIEERLPGGISIGFTDIEGTAGLLRKGIEKTMKDGYAAVFYDPMIDYSYENISESVSTEKSKNALREQVKDFISWLKAQGVI
jgi:hypothetical protein